MRKNNLKIKVIGGVTIATMIASPFIYLKKKIIDMVNEINRLESQVEANEKYEDVDILDTTYEDLKEINAKNTKLIIYEAEAKGFSKTIKDDALIDLEAQLNTSYSYLTTLDLTTSKIINTEGKYIVIVDLSQIKLDKVSIEPMNIEYDLNWLNRWKGKTQAELTSTIIELSSQDIERHVNRDFKENKDLIYAKAKSKIYSIYSGIPCEIVFTGENN